MKTRYQRSERLQDVRYDVRGRNMVEAQAMEAAGEKILHLNIGNVAPFGFETPDAMVRSVIANLRDSEGYSDARGVYSARTAIANYYQEHHIYIDESDVLIGNGVSELITMVLQGMINLDDEVLVPAPDYPLWTASVKLAGGKAIHYLCDEEQDWEPSLEDIEAKITHRTRAIVIINPNNPTGAVYSRETLEGIVALARKHGLVVLSDEIYEKIIYEGTHVHMAGLCGDDVLCFTFSGLSKAYRACGYRAGWVICTGPLEAARNLLDGIELLANMRMCANVPAQHAIQAALGGFQSIDDLVAPGGRFYEQITLAHTMLNQIEGMSCVKAKGSLYLFPRLDPERFDIDDDEDWALGLLRSKRILISHGRGFNWPHPDHFRVVTLPDTDELTEAITRIGEYCDETRIN